MVLRNHLGQFIARKTMFLGRVAGPLLAKIIGVYEAVTWLKERLSTTKLTVETDNLLVKQLWKKIWSITLILILLVFDCKTLLKELPFFPSRMLRNQRIAHCLARASASMSGSMEWDTNAPSLILMDHLYHLAGEYPEVPVLFLSRKCPEVFSIRRTSVMKARGIGTLLQRMRNVQGLHEDRSANATADRLAK
ncbi:hypothetical protein FXO37_07922 [Capsicum annuum]|nr:hypothetical protein FXO37_07922 [Capsicum annuum]